MCYLVYVMQVRHEVDVSYSVIYLNQTLKFEWRVFLAWLQEWVPYGPHVFKSGSTTCSKYDDHCRFNIQHNWEDLSDHLINTKIFAFNHEVKIYKIKKLKKKLIRAPISSRKVLPP